MMKFEKNVANFVQKCKQEHIRLPEDDYDAMVEAVSALKSVSGMQDEALSNLKKKFGVDSNKRKSPEPQDENVNSNQGDMGYEEEEEDMPHHKRVRLAEEIREQPAKCPENQKIVDVFTEYGVSQLERGHTGKGVTRLRAAREIRNHPRPIMTEADARQVGYVGDRMARDAIQVIKHGKIVDEHPELNVSRDFEHSVPSIVQDIRSHKAKCPENQRIVEALAHFGEHELQYGSTSKGTSHLRAAREIRNCDTVISSGQQAQAVVGYIGRVMSDKIDQVLKRGKITEDTGAPRGSTSTRGLGDLAPITEDLLRNPAKCPENQKIVDQLTEYGDAHLQSGDRGKGISHLRAAREIRNSDKVIKSGAEAKQIGMVGDRVARKIDQIFEQGHADSDEDYIEDEIDESGNVGDEEEEEQEEDHPDYGYRSSQTPAPIVQDVRITPAECPENQKLVDALADYGEKQLAERHNGRGIAFLRAARYLRDADEVITSGKQGRYLSQIGNRVADFIDNVLKEQNSK